VAAGVSGAGGFATLVVGALVGARGQHQHQQGLGQAIGVSLAGGAGATAGLGATWAAGVGGIASRLSCSSARDR